MATAQRADSQTAPPRLSPEILDRQPPSNADAERGVLGSILILPEVCDEVAVLLRADDFYDEAHQRIYAHMLAIHNDGRHVDPALLVERLKTAGDLEFIGGPAYVFDVTQSVPTAANAVYYARIVRDKSMLRHLIAAGTDILRDAYDPSTDSREMLSRAEEKVFSILESKVAGEVTHINDVLHEAMDRIDARMQHDHVMAGVETGFTDLDNLLGGLHDSELIILAARPSMGKTALAMNIAENVILKSGAPVLFVSLEMGSLELADRLLCSVARVNGHRLRNGTLSQDDRRRLVEKAGAISRAPLFVDDTPSRTVTEIAANARRMKRRDGLRLVVIDYLQLIEPDNAKDPRQEQVAKIARRLKLLARELKVPILCLAQLNRQTEQGTGSHKPRLSHLRESGAIEQDADVVMFIHREEYYKQDEAARADVAGQAEILVAKQRNGPVDDVKVTWLRDFTRFENAPQYAAHGELEQYNDSPPDEPF